MSLEAERPAMVMVPQRLLDQLHAVERDLTAAEHPHLAEDRQILHMVLTTVEECPHMSRADLLAATEQGDLETEDVINLFQSMICDGDIWHMAPCWQRIAQELVKAGYCYLPRNVN